MADSRALPWSTPPSENGSQLCKWCERNIYLPAEPCSLRPMADIEQLVTPPAPGDRCLYEMRTRGLLPGPQREIRS
jgi:hypothetical protein